MDRRTDRRQGESSMPPLHLRWRGGIMRRLTKGRSNFNCLFVACSTATSHTPQRNHHWNSILSKFSSLAASKVVILTTFDEVSEEHFIKLTTFLMQLDFRWWIYWNSGEDFQGNPIFILPGMLEYIPVETDKGKLHLIRICAFPRYSHFNDVSMISRSL